MIASLEYLNARIKSVGPIRVRFLYDGEPRSILAESISAGSKSNKFRPFIRGTDEDKGLPRTFNIGERFTLIAIE